MAHVSQISFKMNVEVAPYKHEHAEVTVILGPDDTVEDAFKLAKESARRGLGIDVTPEQVAAAKEVLRKARRIPRQCKDDTDPMGCM